MPHQFRRLCLHHPHYSYHLKRSRPQSWSHRHDQLCRLRRMRPLT
jgi:hypothetical protein